MVWSYSKPGEKEEDISGRFSEVVEEETTRKEIPTHALRQQHPRTAQSDTI
jgi:negative regulator of sigma E activity